MPWSNGIRGATVNKDEVLTEAVLGQRLRRAREEAGLTQESLAALIEIDQSSISRMEAGRDVSSLLLTRIAKVTGKDMDYFLRMSVMAEPSYFLRRGEATPDTVVRAVDQMTRLVSDFEFLRSVRP